MRYKLVIAYDGSGYSGWQVQPNNMTVQEKVSESLEKILQEKISLVGSGRTDSGVHALGQVAHFSAKKPIDVKNLLYSLNSLLPDDILILSIEEALDSFHSQKSAIKKTYQYHFHLSRISNPFFQDFIWQVAYNLNIDNMQKAAQYILGEHDFRAFANQSDQGSCARNPVREIQSAFFEFQDPFLFFEISANGFFYKMVRNIVGTLIDIGRGKLKVEEMQTILRSCDRSKASPAAPPQGLYLHSVQYPGTPTIFAKELFPHLQSFHRNKNPDR